MRMASQWYRRTGNTDTGPFSFDQLAQQIREGDLLEDGLVRRAEQSEWQRVDEVIGLLRAARRTEPRRSATSGAPAVDRAAALAKAPARSWLSKPLTRDQLVWRGVPAALASVSIA